MITYRNRRTGKLVWVVGTEPATDMDGRLCRRYTLKEEGSDAVVTMLSTVFHKEHDRVEDLAEGART